LLDVSLFDLLLVEAVDGLGNVEVEVALNEEPEE